MAKFLPLARAVAENLRDGDKVAFEGFTHLIPTAAAHEAIRQGFKNLTLIRIGRTRRLMRRWYCSIRCSNIGSCESGSA